MKRFIRRALAVLLLLCLLPQKAAAEGEIREQDLYAKSAVLLDGGSGRVLYAKNAQEVLPMASTTKIMTCILALEHCGEQEVVTASEKASTQPEVRLGVRPQEQFYLGDLLYALMLESYNDSAVAIAEHVGGSTEQFAAMMNEKAAQLGCTHTHFVTPNGLDGEDEGGKHATTAEELARIMAYCVSESPAKEAFLRITQTKSHSFTNLEGSRSFSCYNHNAFLDMMDGVISGKTGFTSAAGYCYVCALESEGRLFITALLACGWPYNRTYKWSDARTLFRYGKENFESRTIVCSEHPAPLPVEGGLSADADPWKEAKAEVTVDTSGRTERAYLLRRDEQIRTRVTVRRSLLAPVEKGTPVGKVSYYLGEELLEEYPIVTACDVPARYPEHWMRWIWKKFML